MKLAAGLSYFHEGKLSDKNDMKRKLVEEEEKPFFSEDPEDIKQNHSADSIYVMEAYNSFENWMGKGENPKTCNKKLSKRSFHLNPESEWSTTEITESQLEKPVIVCLFKNGGMIKYSSRQTEDGKINFGHQEVNRCSMKDGSVGMIPGTSGNLELLETFESE